MSAFHTKRAMTAYSALVFIITLLIVTTLIATFIMTVATAVKNSAIQVGKESLKDYTGYIKPEIVYATDGRNTTLDDIFIKAKLLPASGEIPITTAVLELDLSNMSADLQYGTGPCSFDATYNENGTAGYWTNATTESGFYTINYLHNGTKHRDGMLVEGDLVKFCFKSPRGITDFETIQLSIIPTKGHPWIYQHEMSPFSDKQVQIFP